MSAAGTGRVFSDAHRAAMSAAQRRRWARARVLEAVENAHRSLTTATSSNPRSEVRLSALMASGASGSGGGRQGVSLEDVQSDYIVKLREFRRCAAACQQSTLVVHRRAFDAVHAAEFPLLSRSEAGHSV
jgi:hypothetical protein